MLPAVQRRVGQAGATLPVEGGGEPQAGGEAASGGGAAAAGTGAPGAGAARGCPPGAALPGAGGRGWPPEVRWGLAPAGRGVSFSLGVSPRSR